MKLCISNIAWDVIYNNDIYSYLQNSKFSGIEIAPTKWIQENPYDNLEIARSIYQTINENYKLEVASIQSMWYGREEKVFSNEESYRSLLEYTKKAILFAEAIECRNLVFGNPKNRIISDDFKLDMAIQFFKEIGDYAHLHNTCIGLEANPRIYNTNFINTTKEALELVQLVDSHGFKLNLDIGTMLINDESVNILENKISLINHVHISEPYLKPIIPKKLHEEVFEILKSEYKNYISIEMGLVDNIGDVKQTIKYIEKLYTKNLE